MPIALNESSSPLPPTAAPVAIAAVSADDARRVPPAAREALLRANLNSRIVQSSLEVSIEAGNRPLALLYRSAIDRLNETLAPELGENAIRNAAAEDQSPEATAKRIVALSTGFFEAYKARHPGEDESVLLDRFVDLIRSGFEQGYADAVGILEGLEVMTGDVQAGVERTHELVLQGYADFVDSHRGSPAEPPSGA